MPRHDLFGPGALLISRWKIPGRLFPGYDIGTYGSIVIVNKISFPDHVRGVMTAGTMLPDGLVNSNWARPRDRQSSTVIKSDATPAPTARLGAVLFPANRHRSCCHEHTDVIRKLILFTITILPVGAYVIPGKSRPGFSSARMSSAPWTKQIMTVA